MIEFLIENIIEKEQKENMTKRREKLIIFINYLTKINNFSLFFN